MWHLDTSIIAVVISVASLVASLMTYRSSISQHSDSETADLIRQLYDDMLKLHELRTEHPFQSHLFELGSQYEIAKAQITKALGREKAEHVMMLALEERSMARRIFSMYESSFYQWKNAEKRGDKSRLEFIKDALDYFTTRLMANPRLLWFWSKEGGALCVHYEKDTNRYYDKHVSKQDIDESGPFQESLSPPLSLPQPNREERTMVHLAPRYVALMQKPQCCSMACLQMILFRNELGLHDQEQMAIKFGVKIKQEYARAFTQDMPTRSASESGYGLKTVDSAEAINAFLANNKFGLRAQSFRPKDIVSMSEFLTSNISDNKDIWVEYHANKIHSDDEDQGKYIHDGLIEEFNPLDRTVIIIDPVPMHRQRITVSLSDLEESISSLFGDETGFLVLAKL